MRQNITSGIQEGNFSGQKIQSLITLFETHLCRINCENILRYLILYVPFFIFLRVLGPVFVCTHTHFFLCAYGKRFLQIHIVIWFLFQLTFGHNKMSLSFTFIYYTFIFLILFWQDNETHFYRVLRNESSFKGGA